MKSHFVFFSIVAAMALRAGFAQETPTPDTAPAVSTAAPTSPEAAPATKPVDLFEQDYDEPSDTFLIPGTKTPYSGPVYSTYDSGKKESTGTLKDGHEEGLWTEYYEDGTKSSEGVYRAGKEEGAWKYWFENGKLQCEASYSDGIPTGRWKTYFESGAPESEGVYIQGKADGEWNIYDEESGKASIVKYKDGVQLTK